MSEQVEPRARLAEYPSPELSVLIVDDDPDVLAVLERMLAPMAGRWRMVFCGNGMEALEALAKAPFNVIVSDLYMPGLAGSELLEAVRERHPEVVRVAFSGETDKAAIVRAMGPAHQYLAKPLRAESLIEVLARAQALSTLLTSPALKRLVGELESLPAQGVAYHRLLDEVNSPEPSIRRIGDIIASDVGMSAKILQLVNSAFFALPRRIASPSEAVVLVGLDTVKALAVATNAFSLYDQARSRPISLNAVRDHSTHVASLAKNVAVSQGMDRQGADGALIAGLLHDVGKLVLAAKLPAIYHTVLKLAADERMPLAEAEGEVVGSTHAELGAYLLSLWGFGDSIVQAVAFHHNPQRSLTAKVTVLTAVHIANIVEHDTRPDNRICRPPDYDDQYLEQVGAPRRGSALEVATEKESTAPSGDGR